MTDKSDPEYKINRSSDSETLIAIERDLATALSAARDLQSGLRSSVEAAIRVSGLDCGGIYLFDKKSGDLNLVYYQGLGNKFIKNVSHFAADSENARMVKQGKNIYLNYKDLPEPVLAVECDEKLLASAILPISYNNEIIGCINISSHNVREISTEARLVLETIAALIGGAIARLRAESALIERDELLKSVFNSSPDAITLISLDGRLIDCNPAALKLFGFPSDANVKGVSIFKYVVESEHAKVIDNIKQTVKNGILNNIEYILIKKDETVFTAELSSSVVYNSENIPTAIIVITKDISERRATERILRDSERYLRNLIDSAPFGAHLYEVDDNQRLIFSGANQAADKILGVSNKQFIGKPIEAAFPSLIDTEIPEAYRRAAISGEPYFTEQITYIDGKVHGIFEVHAVQTGPKRMAAFFQDITERKKSENERILSEQRYRNTFENIGAGTVLINEDKIIFMANAEFERLTGYSRKEIVNKRRWTEFVLPEDLARMLEQSRLRQLDRKTALRQYEFRLITKSGETRDIFLTVDKIPETSDTIASLIDITDRKRAELKLRESEERYRTTFENTGTATVIIDENTIITMANAEFEALTEYSKSEVEGKMSWTKFVYAEDLSRMVQRHNHRRVDRNSVPKQYEFRLVTKRGQLRDIFLRVDMIPGTTNSIAALMDITERKRAEEELRKSEEKYRITFETMGNATILIHEDTTILMANCEFEKISGYPKSEIEGKMSWKKLAAPDDLEKLVNQHNLRRVNKSEALRQYEFRFLTKDGQIRNVLATIDMIPGTTNSLATLVDITERKVAEKALQISEEKFAKAFIDNPAALAITRLRDGKIVDCNNTIKIVLGYDTSEVLGKTTAELGIWANSDERIRMIKALHDGKRVRNWEVKFKAKDGSIKITQYSAEILELNNEQYILAAFIDLTDMKNAEEELIKAKLRYQELFESLMEGVALLDETGKIVFCNPAFISIHEAESMDHLLGKNITEFLVDNDLEVNRGARELWAKGKNSQLEVEIITFRGNKKTILASGTPRIDSENKLTGVLVAIIDITESKRLREFASYAQRLEAAGKIAGQVAHDFNNLLAPMVAYPELIKASIPDDGFVLGMINDIESAARAMADINQQLLTLSRRGHYNLEIINLNDIINLAISQTNHPLDELEIITDFEPELMNIKGGGAQILRIISNLINNGLDAMHERGRLTIKTENYYLDSRAGITGVIPRGEYCKISISDTGCGIPADVMPKIFDAFFTTKVADKKRGSGLGLSVVHAVMEDHQGYIDLESKVNKGTTFYLYFPITRDVIEPPGANEIKGGSESILIIDDDRLQRNVNTNLLNRLGYKIETADSGEIAIAMLKKKPFDLLVIDMIMPGGMDGTETYRKSLEINPRQKAIIISGFAETDRVKEANLLGAGGFLRKPLSMKALAAAIRQELERCAEKPTPIPASIGDPL